MQNSYLDVYTYQVYTLSHSDSDNDIKGMETSQEVWEIVHMPFLIWVSKLKIALFMLSKNKYINEYKKKYWWGGWKWCWGKRREGKRSLRCCLLHNSNLLTCHVVLPPEAAWGCALTSSLCSSSQSGYFGVVVRRAILGITTPEARGRPHVPGWGEGLCVGNSAAAAAGTATTRVCSPPGCQPLQLFVTACLIPCV